MTSITINGPSRMLRFFTKAVWVALITDGMTCYNLSASSFEMILYRHPIRLIGLYSSNVLGSFTFGTKIMNEELQPFSITPVFSNCLIARKTSVPIVSQCFLTNAKVKPSGLGALSDPHIQIDAFISSNVIVDSRLEHSSKVIFFTLKLGSVAYWFFIYL